MTAIEVTGKTLDEAKKLAADKLGVAADQLEVTLLEEAKGKGLFGASKIRIRAAAKSTPEASAVVEAPTKTRAAKEPKAAAEKPASKRAPKKEAPVKEVAAEPSEAPSNGEVEAEPRVEVVASQADADQLVALLEELLKAADLNVSAKSTQLSGRYATIEIDGKDVAFLVGKHGEVLNAMQYLVNIIAGRRFNNGVRATLDGNDYRHRREEALTKLATNIANEVKSRGEEAVLDALPAFERRIVHKALAEFEGISTYSEGEDPNRRVVIAPAD